MTTNQEAKRPSPCTRIRTPISKITRQKDSCNGGNTENQLYFYVKLIIRNKEEPEECS